MTFKEKETLVDQIASLQVLIDQLEKQNQKYEEELHLIVNNLSSQKKYDC